MVSSHRFAGIYDFEVLRRTMGEAFAEEWLLVEYRFCKARGGVAYVVNDAQDFVRRHGLIPQPELTPSGCS